MADVTRGEVLDGWAERHGLRPPAVVARDVDRGEARVIVGMVFAVASVTTTVNFSPPSSIVVAGVV